MDVVEETDAIVATSKSNEIDKEDLRIEITRNLKQAKSALNSWKKDATENYDFVAGRQWSQTDAAILEEQGRPTIVFNRTLRTINAVTGLEIQNRQTVMYLPQEQGDIQVNEVANGAAAWVKEGCDAVDEESESFFDLCVTGVGCTETRISYDEDPDGKIYVERIDPREMLWDPNAKKKNLSDARWVARVKKISKSEVKSMFPEVELDAVESGTEYDWISDLNKEPHDATNAHKYQNKAEPQKEEEQYSVVQYQWIAKKEVYRVPLTKVKNELGQELWMPTQDDSLSVLSKEEFAEVEQLLMQYGLKYKKQKINACKQTFLVGDELTEITFAPCEYSFSFKFMTGYRDAAKNLWFGLVSAMKDPQRWANKWLSQVLHILNSNAKGGLIAEEGAFSNIEKAKEDWAKPNSIVTVREGMLDRVIPKGPVPYPDGFDRLMQYAVQNISDVVGVNLEMLGVPGADQGGWHVESMRRDQAIALLGTLFNSLARYRKEQGRVLMDFITKYLTDGRLVRILGEGKEQYVPLLKDHLTMKYDVVVDSAPSSPNMRDKTFGVLTTLIPAMLQAGIPVPPEVLDYAPIPSGLASKWKEMLQKGVDQDPIAEEIKSIDLMIARLSAEEKQLKNEEIKSKTVLNYAKAEEAQAVSQDEAAQAANKMGLVQAEHEMKSQRMMQDEERKDMKFMLEQRRKDLAMQQQLNRNATTAPGSIQGVMI